MKLIAYCTLFLAGLAFAGCDSLKQEVNPDKLVAEPPKLVVACFISPQDTVLAARVVVSQPVLGIAGSSSAEIPNATVTLSDGKRTIQLMYRKGVNGGNGYYRADVRQLLIVAGQTYTLTAKTANDRLAVDASCTVPGPVAPGNVLVDSTITTNFGLTRTEYYARLRWLDPAGEVNFYRVAGQNEYSYKIQVRSTPNGPVRDSLIRAQGSWVFNNGSTTADLGRDGKELISSRGRLAMVYNFRNGEQLSHPRGKLTAYLLNVDENYYRYHDEVDRQSKVRNNPFAEPVLIQTNIRGGLGCFGAYNKSTLVIDLK